MSRPPAKNLGAGDAWGRWVETAISKLSGTTSQVSQQAVNASMSAQATTAAVGRTATDLTSLATSVGNIQENVGATLDDLDAAKVELETAKAKLEDPETGLAASQQKADDALAAAVGATSIAEKALDTAVLRIDSSRGLVFKNNMVSTILTVTVIRGGEQITNIVDLQSAYGPGAYLEWSWKRLDESDFGVLSSDDSRISQGGFTLTVSPADVDTKVVFMCTLNA